MVQCGVTIVTCYYVVPSKHSHNEYEKWISYWSRTITTKNIVIFTNKEGSIVLSKYFNLNNYCVIQRELDEFPVVNMYANKWWLQQQLDNEKNRTKYCYMIWNCKISMVMEAIGINPFNTDKFMWNDIGNIRKPDINVNLKHYPKYNKISDDKIDVSCLTNRHNITRLAKDVRYIGDNIKSLPKRRFSTSIMSGDINSWHHIASIYYYYLDKFINADIFAGCDERMLTYCIIRHPQLFNVIIPHNIVYNKWFYLYEHHCKYQHVNTHHRLLYMFDYYVIQGIKYFKDKSKLITNGIQTHITLKHNI